MSLLALLISLMHPCWIKVLISLKKKTWPLKKYTKKLRKKRHKKQPVEFNYINELGQQKQYHTCRVITPSISFCFKSKKSWLKVTVIIWSRCNTTYSLRLPLRVSRSLSLWRVHLSIKAVPHMHACSSLALPPPPADAVWLVCILLFMND